MQVLKKSSVYLVTSIINKAIPFLLLPVLTKYLTPTEYGIVSIFQIIISLYTAIIGMAIHTNVSKNFFAYDKSQISILIGNSIFILLISTIFVFVCTLIGSLFFETLFSVSSNWLRSIPIISFMFMINTLNLTILRMEGKAFLFGVFEISNTVVNMGVSILLLVVFNLGWTSRALGILLAYFVFFVVSMVYMKKRSFINFKIDKKQIKAILSISMPLIPHGLGSIIMALSDRLFIENMVGLKAVGTYSVGYMFGMILMIFTDAFIKAWTPWFFKKLTNPTIEVKKKIVKFTYLYLVLLLLLAFIVSFVGNFVLIYFVDSEFYDARIYIFWVALGYVFFGVYQIFFPYLVHINRTSFLAISTFTAAIINLVLNYFMIKYLGAIGAAYATIISFLISAVLVFFYQKKHYWMPWNIFKARHNE